MAKVTAADIEAWTAPQERERERTDHANGVRAAPSPAPVPAKVEPLIFRRASDWQGQSVPERRWLVRNRIPMANVTLLSGDGAAGKTTIALQLAVAVASGAGDWLGAVIDET